MRPAHAGKGGICVENVRIWFEKDRDIRFISHLDLNRLHVPGDTPFRPALFGIRKGLTLIRFNLSFTAVLGCTGKRESMDIKLEERYTGTKS